MSQVVPAWQQALEAETRGPSLRRIVFASLGVIAVGFGGFLGWACVAPLDSAIPAMGSIVVETKRKTVTLLDAGILKELSVKEGTTVAAGQPLLRLDEVQAQAQLGSLKAQAWATVARIARLRAEQADRAEIAFAPDLIARTAADGAVADLVLNERRVFEDRRTTYLGNLAVQEKKRAQLLDQIAATKAQIEAVRLRLAYTNQELDGVNQLLAKGFATKTRLYELQRNQAELRGNTGGLAARVSELEQAVLQNDLETISLRNQRQQDISKDLQDAQAQMADLAEKVRGAEDLLEKKVVLAPESGTVTDIKFVTPGSSIGAGQPILDIVPQHDAMVVEANIRPEDIEHVHPGQRVNVRLTAYKQRKVPIMGGRLVYVSADRQLDAKGEPFFLTRAEIDRRAMAAIRGVTLYAGMPAEVLIIGGERTAIDYFISPITDSLRRAFREE